MTAAAYVISILLQLVLPAALVFFIIHRFATGWKFAILGAIAYMAASLIGNIVTQFIITKDLYDSMMNSWTVYWLIFLLSFLITGLLQQIARVFSFRFSGGPGTTWQQTLTMAAGFAGFELIMLGVQLASAFFTAIQFNSNGGQGLNLTADQLAVYQSQIASFWARPTILILLDSLPNLSAFVLQFALAAMAWVAIRSRSYLWHAAAVLWMAMVLAIGIVLRLWNSQATIVENVYPPDAAISLMGFLGLILGNLVLLYVFYFRIIPMVEEIPVPVQPVIVPARARNAPPEEPKLPANEKKNRPVKPVKLPKNNE